MCDTINLFGNTYESLAWWRDHHINVDVCAVHYASIFYHIFRLHPISQLSRAGISCPGFGIFNADEQKLTQTCVHDPQCWIYGINSSNTAACRDDGALSRHQKLVITKAKLHSYFKARVISAFLVVR